MILAGRGITPEPPEHIDPELWRYLYENFSILQYAALVPYSNRVVNTVANTTVETELVNIPFGPNSLFAYSSGCINMSGIFSTGSGADSFTLRFYLNSTLLHTLIRPAGGTKTNVGWEASFRGSMLNDGVAGTFNDFAELIADDRTVCSGNVAAHTIDTTVINNLRATVQWNAAKVANTISVKQSHYMNYDGDSGV